MLQFSNFIYNFIYSCNVYKYEVEPCFVKCLPDYIKFNLDYLILKANYPKLLVCCL